MIEGIFYFVFLTILFVGFYIEINILIQIGEELEKINKREEENEKGRN